MGAQATRSQEGHYATYREDILSGITPQLESLSLESIYSQYYFDHGRTTSTDRMFSFLTFSGLACTEPDLNSVPVKTCLLVVCTASSLGCTETLVASAYTRPEYMTTDFL